MNLETFVSLLTAITSIIAIAVALYAVWTQNRQSNTTLRVTIIRDFRKDFDSDMVKHQRLATATFLLNRKPNDIPPTVVYDVLDFFDMLGIYFSKNVLETGMAWSMFYYWIGHYWKLLEKDAENLERQQGNVPYYKDLRAMYKRLTKFAIKNKMIPSENKYFTESNLRLFLEDEIRTCSLLNTAELLDHHEYSSTDAKQKKQRRK